MMPVFVLLIFVLVLVFLLLTAGGARARSDPARWSAYQQVARECGGTVHHGKGAHPCLAIPYQNMQARLEFLPRSSGDGRQHAATRLSIHWPDPQFWAQISHPPRLTPPDAHVKHVTCRTGDRAFDREYSIHSSDPDRMLRGLSPVVRELAERLRLKPYPSSLVIQFGRSRMDIAKSADLRRPSELHDFVRGGLDLADQMQLSVRQQVRFLDEPASQPLDQVVCAVCGQPIDRELVFCPRCKTATHRDCWRFIGKCSTYGCGQTDFQTPQTARRVQRPGPA